MMVAVSFGRINYYEKIWNYSIFAQLSTTRIIIEFYFICKIIIPVKFQSIII